MRWNNPSHGMIFFVPRDESIRSARRFHSCSVLSGQSAVTVLFRKALPAFRSEKVFHQRGTFVRQYAFHYRGFRMQSLWRITLVSPFFVFRAKHQPSRLRPCNGSGTHDARLNGDIKSTFIEIFTAKRSGGGSNRLHFGMRGHIGQSLSQIMGTGNNAVLSNNDSPNGYFPPLTRLLRFKKRLLHIIRIRHFLPACCLSSSTSCTTPCSAAFSSSHIMLAEQRRIIFLHIFVDKHENGFPEPA